MRLVGLGRMNRLRKNEQDNEYIMCRPTLHLFVIFIYYLLLSYNRYKQSTSLKKIYTFLVFYIINILRNFTLKGKTQIVHLENYT